MSDGRSAWLELSSGVAGDMVLGSLLDAGAPVGEIRSMLEALALPGWSLGTEQVMRQGLRATRAIVGVSDDDVARPYRAIKELITDASLPDRVVERSLRAFHALAIVEADLHHVAIDDVHFHEVGGHDAIIDVVGTMAALECLEVAQVSCSAIGVGTGAVHASHGVIPGPAPATARLLVGFALAGIDVDVELATPTGAAIVAALCTGSSAPTSMVLSHHGMGAGSRDLPGRANVVGAFIGVPTGQGHDRVGFLETTLDDVTGEHLALAISELVAAGALDAWVQPVVMKKGRPGHTLSVVCAPDDIDRLATVVHQTTRSLGVRLSLLERSVLDRTFGEVVVAGHRIRVKVSPVGIKPEVDDVAEVAARTGMSVRDVDDEARRAFEEASDNR